MLIVFLSTIFLFFFVPHPTPFYLTYFLTIKQDKSYFGQKKYLSHYLSTIFIKQSTFKKSLIEQSKLLIDQSNSLNDKSKLEHTITAQNNETNTQVLDKPKPKSDKKKKLVKYLFTSGVLSVDTDPNMNRYFTELYDNLFLQKLSSSDSDIQPKKSNKHTIIVIKTRPHYDQSYKLKFDKLYPTCFKKYQYTSNKTNHMAYLILELPNNKFCPFGTTYIVPTTD